MNSMTAPCVRLMQMKKTRVKQGVFCNFLCMYIIQHCFICRPSDSTVSENAGIEPRTVSAFGTGGQAHKPLGYISSTSCISSKTRVAYLLCGHQADLPLVNVPQDADALLGKGGHQGVPRHSQQVSLIKHRLRANLYCCGRDARMRFIFRRQAGTTGTVPVGWSAWVGWRRAKAIV